MWCTSNTSVTPSEQPGQDEPDAGPDVAGADGRCRELLLATDHRMMSIGAHIGTHTCDLVAEGKARFEDVLGDHGRALGDGKQGDGLRLQICSEARVGQRHDIERPRPVVHAHPEPVWRGLDVRASGGELVQRDLQMSGAAAMHGDVASGDGGREQVPATIGLRPPRARSDGGRRHLS
jgi:hypothetical protein